MSFNLSDEEKHIRRKWPKLTETNFTKNSDFNPYYNCIAFAANEDAEKLVTTYLFKVSPNAPNSPLFRGYPQGKNAIGAHGVFGLFSGVSLSCLLLMGREAVSL